MVVEIQDNLITECRFLPTGKCFVQENLLALTPGPQKAARYEFRKSIFWGVEIK